MRAKLVGNILSGIFHDLNEVGNDGAVYGRIDKRIGGTLLGVTTGCATEEAPDGTLCGPDDCLATQVDVCISGSCVTRVRPDSGRCANRWVPTSIPAQFGHATYDAARQRVVLFGDGTWEWDGTKRTSRTKLKT